MPLVLLAAGGTGGHLFPAEALADALKRRGVEVDLATDERATRYGHDFPSRQTHVIPSATIRGRGPLSLARTVGALGVGAMKALLLLRRIRPAAVVGFGGYPTLPPVLAATLRGIPTVVHDANAVMGRANRVLSSRVTAIATSFPNMTLEPLLAAKATFTGNPVRPMVIVAAQQSYPALDAEAPIKLLVFGGSQGARVMADIVPPAIERALYYTPFPYQLFFPVSIYVGKTTGHALYQGLLIQTAWVVASYLLARWVWKRGIRKYSAVGG